MLKRSGRIARLRRSLDVLDESNAEARLEWFDRDGKPADRESKETVGEGLKRY